MIFAAETDLFGFVYECVRRLWHGSLLESAAGPSARRCWHTCLHGRRAVQRRYGIVCIRHGQSACSHSQAEPRISGLRFTGILRLQLRWLTWSCVRVRVMCVRCVSTLLAFCSTKFGAKKFPSTVSASPRFGGACARGNDRGLRTQCRARWRRSSRNARRNCLRKGPADSQRSFRHSAHCKLHNLRRSEHSFNCKSFYISLTVRDS